MPTGKTKVATKYLGKYKEMNPNAVEGKDYYIEDKPKSSGTSGSGAKGFVATGKDLAEKTGVKKSGGAVSYKDSYTDAVASKWEAKGGYDAYEKAAKAWNEKKYGTTEPTAKAKKLGISKTELSEASKPITMKPKEAVPISISTPNNNKMQRVVEATNAPESLLGGVQTRRETRQANRLKRQSERKKQRQSPLTKSGRPKFGAGRNKFKKATQGFTPSDKVISAIGSALSTSGTPKAEAKKKIDWKSSLSNKTFGM